MLSRLLKIQVAVISSTLPVIQRKASPAETIMVVLYMMFLAVAESDTGPVPCSSSVAAVELLPQVPLGVEVGPQSSTMAQ